MSTEYYTKLNGGVYPRTPAEWRAVDAAHQRNVTGVKAAHLRQYCRDLSELRYPRWIRRLRRILNLPRGETS